MKKISGILIILVGLAALFGSYYINNKIKTASEMIEQGQKKINKKEPLLSFSPITKEVEKEIKEKFQKKIDEANLEISKYQRIANWLQYGGIVFLILGNVLFIWSFFHKDRKV